MLSGNSGIQSIFAVDKVTIQENLTAYRKEVCEAASMVRRDLRFNYLWTSQGRIRLRKDSESETINTSSFSDFDKIGYSIHGILAFSSC